MAMRKVHSGQRNNNRRRHSNNRRSNDSDNYKASNNNQSSVLPSPSVLQEYEYATEGAADRILEMAEVEQDRRNNWEDEYLAYYKKSLRIGQLFGFFLLLSVVLSFVFLTNNGYGNFAIGLAVIAFFSVAVSNFFSSIGRRKSSKRPSRYKK